MHAFVAAVLFGMPGSDAFDIDAEAKPPDGEFAQALERAGACEGDAIVGADRLGQTELCESPFIITDAVAVFGRGSP